MRPEGVATAIDMSAFLYLARTEGELKEIAIFIYDMQLTFG
jgi:hypothetical protein